MTASSAAGRALRYAGGSARGRLLHHRMGHDLLACYEEVDASRPRTGWELDHPPYLGQLFETAAGVALDSRRGDRTRIFAYPRPGRLGFAETEAALSSPDAGWDVILAAPGVSRESRERLERAGVRVVDGPARLDRALTGCDLAITHASNGTVAAALATGVPQIGLPSQAEQVMAARAIGEQGLGLAGRYSDVQVRELIDRALGSPALRDRCRAASARIAARHPDDPAAAMADRIHTLAAGRARGLSARPA